MLETDWSTNLISLLPNTILTESAKTTDPFVMDPVTMTPLARSSRSASPARLQRPCDTH
jgi:hypothetical protein